MLTIGECGQNQSGGGNISFNVFVFFYFLWGGLYVPDCQNKWSREKSHGYVAEDHRGDLSPSKKPPFLIEDGCRRPRYAWLKLEWENCSWTQCALMYSHLITASMHAQTYGDTLFTLHSHHRLVSLWEEVGHFLRRSYCSLLMYYRLRLSKNNASGL